MRNLQKNLNMIWLNSISRQILSLPILPYSSFLAQFFRPPSLPISINFEKVKLTPHLYEERGKGAFEKWELFLGYSLMIIKLISGFFPKVFNLSPPPPTPLQLKVKIKILYQLFLSVS